jgi:FKBP-type peptidyl-prolyl cis-trans isomerase 2
MQCYSIQQVIQQPMSSAKRERIQTWHGPERTKNHGCTCFRFKDFFLPLTNVSGKYTISALSGAELESSPFSFSIGDGSICEVVDAVVKEMKEGDDTSIEVKCEDLYGPYGCPFGLSTKDTVHLQVQLFHRQVQEQRPIDFKQKAEERKLAASITSCHSHFVGHGADQEGTT